MVDGLPSEVEVITLFVDDIASSKVFYAKVFTAETVWSDDVSSVLKFSGLLINLLAASQAPRLWSRCRSGRRPQAPARC